MSKRNSTQVTEQWLLDKGYSQNKDGSWQPPTLKSKFIQSLKDKEEISTPKQPVNINLQFHYNKPLESFVEIHGVVAGLNGPEGLMRGHWTKIKKIKELYATIIRQHLKEGKVKKHIGEVRVRYIGYKSHFMDWDNFCASFKHIGDALVKEGIIKEDNPKIITQFLPEQIKCKKVDQKVVIIIEDVKV